MYKLYPYFTNDGSVGLFSPDVDDIYHSTYGALTEAYEKFILPSNIKDFLKKNNEIKILDICFGIGYNSKSFINFLLDFIYNETIGTNKINNIDKIYTDNKKYKVFIHALDNDKNLALLSPFFVTDKKISKNNKLPFVNEKIIKMLSGKTESKYKLKKEVNILLLQKLISQIDDEVIKILNTKEYAPFFDKMMVNLLPHYGLFKNSNDILCHLSYLINFLHNIYYKYISSSYKMAFKALNLLDFDFNLEINDARQSVKNDCRLYNYIFLDAFTAI